MVISLKDEFSSLIDENYKSVIRQIISIARQMNIKIYLIGGIVRDLILKTPIKDVDITVEGNAIDFCINLQNKFDCKIIAKQDNLKTAKVEFLPGIIIDFASTREEIYKSSGTLPVAYNFGCELSSDVKRRDFTINTLAIILTGNDKYKLIDKFDGYGDIKNKKIRVLHNKSFQDDPSRIIRALKFKERFDFEFDDETYLLMQKYLEHPNKNMPLERIKSELKQYFSINKDNLYDEIITTKAYKLITDNPLLKFNKESLKYLVKYKLFSEKDLPFIYLSLLLINSDFNSAKMNLNSFDKKVLNEVLSMINSDYDEDDNEKIYKTYSGKEDLSLAIYYLISENRNIIKFITDLKGIKILSTGKDLIELGLKPSKYFSEIFDKLLREKLKNKIKTKEEEIEFINTIIKKESI